MSYYKDDDLLRYKKSIKNTAVGITVLLLASIALNVLFCLLIDSVNSVIIQLTNTCISTFCVFVIIYRIDTVIVSASKKIKHYKEIVAAPKAEFRGKVQKIGDLITVGAGLKSREICFAENKKIYSFYLLEDFGCDFEVGDVVNITVAKKHIIHSLIIERSEKESYA